MINKLKLKQMARCCLTQAISFTNTKSTKGICNGDRCCNDNSPATFDKTCNSSSRYASGSVILVTRSVGHFRKYYFSC